ncbi:MAG: hypothetical protein MJ072_03515, partial [Clostridia bacterium]|nr:hypothetical protein [Clostridia bacterium]
YKYDLSKVNLTSFGQDVADAFETSLLAVAKTNTAISLSGALEISTMNADFIKLATSPTCNADAILAKFYSMQKQDWDDRLKKFNVK